MVATSTTIETKAPKRSPKIAAARALLMVAFLAAQREAQGVEKVGHVDGPEGYSYAAAEDMIIEAKAIMSKHGLALMRLGQRVLDQNGDGSSLVLATEWVLVHAGGGEVHLKAQEWPIVPEPGRPLDKATAAAATASLAYFLRDLLQLPRVEEGTRLDHRSREVASGRARAGSGGAPKSGRGKLNAEAQVRAKIGAEFDRIGVADDETERARRAARIIGRTPRTMNDLHRVLRKLTAEA